MHLAYRYVPDTDDVNPSATLHFGVRDAPLRRLARGAAGARRRADARGWARCAHPRGQPGSSGLDWAGPRGAPPSAHAAGALGAVATDLPTCLPARCADAVAVGSSAHAAGALVVIDTDLPTYLHACSLRRRSIRVLCASAHRTQARAPSGCFCGPHAGCFAANLMGAYELKLPPLLQSLALHWLWTRRAACPPPHGHADARAAHPPRQGGVPHLHNAGEGLLPDSPLPLPSFPSLPSHRSLPAPPLPAFHLSPPIARRSSPTWPPSSSTRSTTG